MKTNHDIYSEVETAWGINQTAPLNLYEQYLIDKYAVDTEDKVIEAGCGGGRIALYVEKKGFQRINAFDYCKEFIDIACKQQSNIDFKVADATDLIGYQDEEFDILIYLQRIVSFIPIEKIPNAIEEAYRICKANGRLIISFLHYDGRKRNRIMGNLLSMIRWIRGEKQKKQQLPWLKLGGKPNWKFLSKGQATNYWFQKDEIEDLLNHVGFVIDEMFSSDATLDEETKTMHETKCKGTVLYYVCHK